MVVSRWISWRYELQKFKTFLRKSTPHFECCHDLTCSNDIFFYLKYIRAIYDKDENYNKNANQRSDCLLQSTFLTHEPDFTTHFIFSDLEGYNLVHLHFEFPSFVINHFLRICFFLHFSSNFPPVQRYCNPYVSLFV